MTRLILSLYRFTTLPRLLGFRLLTFTLPLYHFTTLPRLLGFRLLTFTLPLYHFTTLPRLSPLTSWRLGFWLLTFTLPLYHFTTLPRLWASDAPTWLRPKIYIYQPPPVEISTSPVYRTVDPQIIQKLIDLLSEDNLGKEEKYDASNPLDVDNKSIGEIRRYQTPRGLELKNRYTRLGVALSESMGWEPIKHIRVISEQNLQQRLTTIGRWDHATNVRSTALLALATLKDKNDLVYFQEALWSKDINVRFATVEALLKWGYPEAMPILQNLVEKDDSYLIRVVAASALAKLSNPYGNETLRKNLENQDWFVRALSAKALGESGTAEDYDLLVDQINREQTGNPNHFIIAEAAIAALKLFPLKLEKEKQQEELKKQKKLKKIVPPAPPAKPHPKSDVVFELDPLVVVAPRLKIQQEELVDPRINFQILRMLQSNPDETVSQEMINQSIAYKDLNALETPNGIRLKTHYTILGILLTEGLIGTRDFQLLDQLTRIARGETTTQSTNPLPKLFSAITLAYTGDTSYMGIFHTLLQSNDPADRFAAVEALETFGNQDAASILLGVTKLDSSPVIRVYAAQAALRLGELNGKDYLIQSLNEQDWVARAMAMRYLGELGGAEDYNRILAFFGLQQKEVVQAEMCSALLRLYTKKFAAENRP